MRVVRINAVYGLSSTGRTVKQLDKGLKKYGVDSTTVYFAGNGTDRDYRMNTPNGVKLHGLLARITGKSGYFSKNATRKMLRYIDSQKPDLVHVHNLHSNFVNIPMLFRYLSDKEIPTVITLHDCWWFTGKCSHYTTDKCQRWLSGCGNCPRLKKDIPSWFFDRTKKLLSDKKKWIASVHPLAVIGVSDWITNEAKKTFLGKADIIQRVYNWIDTETFKPIDSDIKRRNGLEGKFVLLAVASKWMNSKGLASFTELSHMLPDDTVLVMIGNMPQDQNFNSERVKVIPATNSQSELADWYSAADIFISLSKEESFGKVTAEALACGTPVISINSTACPELVGDNCGVVIDDDRSESVLNAIDRIKTADRDEMSRNCRNFALANFDMEGCVSEIANVYSRILQIRTGGN